MYLKCISKTIRLSFLLVVAFSLCRFTVEAQTFNTSVSVSAPQKLKHYFQLIEKKSDLKFVYSQEVDENELVQLSVSPSDSVDYVFGKLKESTSYRYIQRNNQVLVFPKEEVLETPAKGESIKGYVLDSDGQPVIGANLIVLGTTTGAVTDLDGSFSFNLESPGPEAILKVSAIGYLTSTIKIGVQSEFRIILKENVQELSEMVVIGYGQVERKDVTGAVASVNSKQITDIASPNFMDAIQGKVAGLDVTLGSSAPGQQMGLLIRGKGSITASNEPVVVVDGMPIQGGLNEINPADIESIEVLKDASSTAIYGSRGSNGVILITTKRGKNGQSRVALDSYVGITSVSKKLDLMNGEEFAEMKREANRAAGNNATDENLFDAIALRNLQAGNYTDWQDLMFTNGFQQNHQLSISGGNEQLQSAVTVGLFDEKGVIDDFDFRRINLRTNLDYKVTDWLKIGTSSMLSMSKTNSSNPDGQNIFDNIIRLNPLGDAYDEDGNIRFRPTTDEGQRVNPLSDIANITNKIESKRFLSSIYAEAKISPWLSYRLNVGLDYLLEDQGSFYGSETSRNQGGSNSAEVYDRNKFGYMVDNILTADFNWQENHHLTGTFVFGVQHEENTYSHIKGARIPNDRFQWTNMGAAEQITSTATSFSEWLLVSYLARVNYSFKDRYIVTASSRVDGSSRFGDGNKYGVFPSVAFAWRVAEEEFFNAPSWLDDIKFRVSYGAAGNTGIPPYQSLGSLKSSAYVYGDRGASGFAFQDLANSELRWEKTNSFNIGMDLSLFEGRLFGNLEYYNSLTNDLLLESKLPGSTGYSSVLQNIGSVRNSGVELGLTSINATNTKFTWKSSLNLALNKNQIEGLYGEGMDDQGNSWFIGEPIEVIYNYKKIGIWQSDETDEAATQGFKPGQIKISDEREIIGQLDPKVIAGFTNTLQYKNLEFSFLLTGKFGHVIYSEIHTTGGRLDGRYNNLKQDYWTPDNPTNAYPRPDAATQGPSYGSTNVVFDGDFIRLKNITLAYSLAPVQLEKIGLTHLRIYFQSKNPKVWTDYEGFDPEFGTKVSYPAITSFIFGLNLTL